jgi:hypothetical protein
MRSVVIIRCAIIIVNSGVMFQAIRPSETSGTTQRTTRRHIREEDTLHKIVLFLVLTTYNFLYLREGAEPNVSVAEQGPVACCFEHTVLDLGIKKRTGCFHVVFKKKFLVPVKIRSRLPNL